MKTLSALVAVALLSLPLSAASAGLRDVVETAENTGKFSRLLEAAAQAGIVDKLKGDGPFTVLAPTDEAFAGLDPDFIRELLQPENKEELAELLKHHIIPGKVLLVDIRGNRGEKTVENVRGGKLTFSRTAGEIIVGDARIVEADVMASNGVIHIVDSIIDPEM
ncbi:MAG TPA: fasciclin domain-containing protein [Hyphomicrobiaceae bacterium]|nr:fasciclin domain-containing protein [Hyphomicrobiaceae bacterium]